MRYVLGIDAGGTKTVALLADESGRVVASARGGGANLQTHGELEVEKVFHRLLDALAESVGDPEPLHVAAVCLGIAGVDRPRDEEVVRGLLRRLGLRRHVRVTNDAAIALAAGAPDGVGIVVLAGTGSIAYGRDAAGHVARAGGHGYLLADEGSAYWFGHEALRAAIRSAESRGPATLLEARLFAQLGVVSAGELVPLVYGRGLPKHRIAELAIVVQRAADDGDAVAEGLLREGAAELAVAARAVAAGLAFATPFPVVLAGGAFRACRSLEARVREALALPLARPLLLDREPAHGAVTLALAALHGADAAPRGDAAGGQSHPPVPPDDVTP